MCGILGYIGQNLSVNHFFDKFKKLQYRGYDSCGILYKNQNENTVIKVVGNIDKLYDKAKCKMQATSLYLGHTRWATSGKPYIKNAHPICSNNKQVFVTHNGVISNFYQLQEEYLDNTSTSEQDTKVFANLIEHFLYLGKVEAIKKALELIEGNSAFAIVFADENAIFCATKGISLFVGKSEHGCFISSDIQTFYDDSIEFAKLEDNKVIKITTDNAYIQDLHFKKTITLNKKAINAQNYKHKNIMENELWEQPQVVNNLICQYIKNDKIQFDFDKKFLKTLKNITKIVVVASGSSYNAGKIAINSIQLITTINCSIMYSSQFCIEQLKSENALIIFISQSGETLDVINAYKVAKKNGLNTMVITNNEFSTLALLEPHLLLTYAGQEIAVASTKCFTAELVLLYLLFIFIAKIKKKVAIKQEQEYLSELSLLPQKITQILKMKNHIQNIALKTFEYQKVLFVGDGIDFDILQEADLKYKEITYKNSHTTLASEIKHGELAVVDAETIVFILCSDSNLQDKILTCINEIKTRNGKTCCFVAKKIAKQPCFIYPATISLFIPILAIIPFQLLALYSARALTNNVDMPRNLAKCITV